MKYFVTINGKKYEVDVERAAGSEQKAAELVVENRSAAPAPVSGSGEEVKAPMPGTILNVKVKEGQAIKKGDVLFILEAMKMENEIMAGRDAVVSKIAVQKGTSVKTGDVLALLK